MKVHQSSLHLDHFPAHCNLGVSFLAVASDYFVIEFLRIISFLVGKQGKSAAVIEIIVKFSRIKSRRKSKAVDESLMIKILEMPLGCSHIAINQTHDERSRDEAVALDDFNNFD